MTYDLYGLKTSPRYTAINGDVTHTEFLDTATPAL